MWIAPVKRLMSEPVTLGMVPDLIIHSCKTWLVNNHMLPDRYPAVVIRLVPNN